MSPERRSRRGVLRAGSALVAAGIAGCLSGGSGAGNLGPDPVIEGTSVDGRTLIVELPEDHSVSKLNLIGPSGSQFDSASVATGATSVEFVLFDYERDWQYTPGEHTLVAVDGEDELGSTEVDLRPELKITNVERYTGGRPTPSNRANLLVTVENTGTGPTWVYYVGYEDATHPPANQIPRNDYARSSPLLNLEKPESERSVILGPDESSVFLGTDSPLLLTEQDSCDGSEFKMTVIVPSGIGNDAKQDVSVTLGGDPVRANFRGTCSDITINTRGGNSSDD